MSATAWGLDAGSPERCKSCRAPIWFGLTAKGRRTPIDLAPTEDGNMVVDRAEQAHGQPGRLPRVRVLGKGEAVVDVARYVSHFATCPKSKRHRREERKHNGSRAKARAMGIEARS